MRIAELLDLIGDFEREYGDSPSRIYVSYSERRELYNDMIGAGMQPGMGERAIVAGVPIEFVDGRADAAHLETLVEQNSRVETASGVNGDPMTRVVASVPGLPVRATILPSGPGRSLTGRGDTGAAMRLLADDLRRQCPDWHRLVTTEQLRTRERVRRWVTDQRANMAWFDESATVEAAYQTLGQCLSRAIDNQALQQFNPQGTQTVGQVLGHVPSLEVLRRAGVHLAAVSPPPARADFGLSGQWDAARYSYAPSPASQPETRLTDED